LEVIHIKNYSAIIFDLDGTLLDTLGDLSNSVNFVLTKHGFPEITLDDTRRFVGNGIAKLIESALPEGLDNPLFDKCLEEFGSHYSQNMEILTKPYPGIMKLLGELTKKQYKIAIVSNKFDGAVKTLSEKYFGEYISIAIGESKGLQRKPAPDTVFEALKELNVNAADAVYVGDSEVDILTARNAGLPCVSVSWGFRDREILLANGAERIIDSPVELLNVLGEKLPE
jgi:phosphoglycolate phosphatase